MVRAIDPEGRRDGLRPLLRHRRLPRAGCRVHEAEAGHEGVRPAADRAAQAQTFWGREKENLIYPIGLANLILHGIDDPHIWHGNTLTGHEVYGGLFDGAPTRSK